MAPNFQLSSQLFAEAFWRGVLWGGDSFESIRGKFLAESLELESLREHASYNTGSISAFSAWVIFLLCHYFRINRALEVGTFIGRSTTSIAMAMNLDGGGEIHTCDASNDIEIPQRPPTKIFQYRRQTSNQMLSSLKGKFDFAFIDGRLSGNDINLLGDLLTEDSIIALDDFEGIEKGVANLFNLRSHPRFQHLFLCPPAGHEVASKLGFSSRSLVAVLLPPSRISLSNQG